MTLSLLAHLYSYIRGSQEDVATLSLQYILKQSPDLNAAFTRLVSKALQAEPGEEIHYVCQVTGDNKERPDIAGISDSGKEMILCEAKFYAGLTINQPNTYLDRLKKENGLGLVFICPAARKITLWSKLIELCEHRKLEKNDEYCVTVDGVRMSIITWGEIIETLRFVASTLSVSSLSDINQLDGFCRLVDETSFIPFEQEDFGPENARREERHYEILDALFNYLIADKSLHANAKKLRATAYRSGYVRYIRVKGHGLSICYDRTMWMENGSEETPYWVGVCEENFDQPESYLHVFKRFPESWKTENGDTYLALFAPVNASLDEVVESLAGQILDYINVIDKEMAGKADK